MWYEIWLLMNVHCKYSIITINLLAAKQLWPIFRQLINSNCQVHSPCAILVTPTSVRTRAEYTFMMICVLFTWWKCTISYDTQCIVLHAFDFNWLITQRFSRWFPMRLFQRQAPIICVRIVSRKWFEKIKNCVYFITKWQQVGAQAFG